MIRETHTRHGLAMNLQLFAQSSGEKTEDATPRRREKAREEGQVAKSTEITTAAILVIMFSVLRIFGLGMAQRIVDMFATIINLMGTRNIDMKLMEELLHYVIIEMGLIMFPVLAIAFAVGFITNVVQVGWKPSFKPMQPKLSNINPLSGIKRMFSLKTVVELIKSILKISIILVIVYLQIRDYENLFYIFYDKTLFEAYGAILTIALDVGIRIGAFFIVVALIDYIYQRYSVNKKLKMSKQEVKDEYKLMEGNPEVKGKIKQRMREASMRRMMQDLPQADVVITNPTHFAVAIQYDEAMGRAPRVIAKGADIMAARIRSKATDLDIALVENKPLARTLYYTVEIGEEIPPELYQTVAEVLAFVYNLKHKKEGAKA